MTLSISRTNDNQVEISEYQHETKWSIVLQPSQLEYVIHMLTILKDGIEEDNKKD